MQRLRPFVLSFVLLPVSLLIIYWLFSAVHPYGGLYLPLTADSLLARSRAILNDLGIDRTGMTSSVQLKGDRELQRQIQHRFGLEKSNRLIRDSLPGYVWDVRWRKEDPQNLMFGSNSGNSKQAQAVVDFLKGDVSFQFDTRGKVLSFERKIPDSAQIANVTSSAAKLLAFAFVRKYSTWGFFVTDTSALASERVIEQPLRIDHEFGWTGVRPVLGNQFKAKVTIAGNQFARFVTDEQIPKDTSTVNAQHILGIILVVVYFGVGIAMVIVAFRRFRSYEIGFRLAIIAGIVTGIFYDVTSYLEVRNELGWVLLVTLVAVPLFVGGALLFCWAVAESAVRETWKEKFVSFDLLGKGHLLQPRVGGSILQGIAGGFGALAIWLVLAIACDRSFGLWMSFTDDISYHSFDVAFPPLYVIAHTFNINIFVFTFFVVFVVSVLRKYLSRPWLLIFTSAIVMGILNAGHIFPLPAGFLIQVAVSAVSIAVFFYYDGVAALVSMVTFSALQETAGLFVAGTPTFTESGVVLAGLFAAILIISVITLYRKNPITDFDDIAPAFARHITERQRLQQELEIARSVQMSFLPKANPVTSRLDIASRCAPAQEVGGDYYDFINLGDKKLGVAVGDVSGKGTQAAFFMTLTKGFLDALAHVSESPSEILAQVNKLFYENVERGMFISMVYGIFDLGKNSLRLARAGHNPVIMRKSQAADVEVVNPTGLALGLDQGDVFDKSIQEVTIKFQTGDLFVFYTDGFPEAMNKTMEEFGEERLCKTVEKYAKGSAAEIMESVFKDMKQFTGKAKQHDDMTIVVVKIL